MKREKVRAGAAAAAAAARLFEVDLGVFDLAAPDAPAPQARPRHPVLDIA